MPSEIHDIVTQLNSMVFIIKNALKMYFILKSGSCRGESAALSRMPWANRLFSKRVKGKISNFLHKVQFPFLKKNRPHLQKTKINFLFKVFLY